MMSLEQVPAWIPLIVFICGLIGTAWRVGYIVGNFASKIDKQMADYRAEFNALLELKEAENGKAIGRVYERFDTYKCTLESCFVRRESCTLTHNATSLALAAATETATAATALAADATKELKASIERLNDKVDALLIRGMDK